MNLVWLSGDFSEGTLFQCRLKVGAAMTWEWMGSKEVQHVWKEMKVDWLRGKCNTAGLLFNYLLILRLETF